MERAVGRADPPRSGGTTGGRVTAGGEMGAGATATALISVTC
jgi:hypothetical protein